MNNLKVICLITLARSGSKLLYSLFDSHENILSFPRTLNFYSFWERNNHLDKKPHLLVKNFIKEQPRYFNRKIWEYYNPLDNMYDQEEYFELSESKFEKFFLEEYNQLHHSAPRINAFISFYYAYARLQKKNLDNKKIIFYHLHDIYGQEEAAKQISQDFKDNVQFILMTRNPIDSMRSIINWLNNVYYIKPDEIYHYQTSVFSDSQILKTSFKNSKYKIIPFEQLHKNTKSIMMNLTKWLDINWNESLLESTVNGKKWKGNAKKIMHGTNINRVKQTIAKNFFENNDYFVFNAFFPERMNLYGYNNNNHKNNRNILTQYARIFIPTYSEIIMLINFFKFNYIKSIYLYIKNPNKNYRRYKLKDLYLFNNNIYITLIIYIRCLFAFIYYYVKRVMFYIKTISSKIKESESDILKINR